MLYLYRHIIIVGGFSTPLGLPHHKPHIKTNYPYSIEYSLPGTQGHSLDVHLGRRS